MNIKQIISVGLCIITVSSLTVYPVSAAKSASLENAQIVNQVKLFNESKLKELNQYILKINAKHPITKDLINLYQKLDNLVVYDIKIANELNTHANLYNKSLEIGSLLEHLFNFLEIIEKPYTQNTFTAEMRASSIMKSLNKRLDEINVSNNSGQLNFKSKEEKIDHMIAYLHAVIPYNYKYIGINLANEFNKTFEDKTYKNDQERMDHIIAYLHYAIPYELKEVGIQIANEFNKTFA